MTLTCKRDGEGDGAGVERSSDAVTPLTATLTVTLTRYVLYQSVLPGMVSCGLEELLVQTDNSGRHCPSDISLSTVHVYSGVTAFDEHCDNQTSKLILTPLKTKARTRCHE